MRIFLLTLIAFVYFCPQLQAQDSKEYEDLWVLYIDENYEKLVSKAKSITESDKTKKEPMPYLFVSMGYFEISKKEDMAEDYPRAFKEAMKYAGKWRKKDKSGTYAYDNKDYIADLREASMEVAEGYLEDGSYSKAKSYYKYMTKFDPTCPGSWLMYSFALKKMNDFSTQKEAYESFVSNLGDISKLSSEQQRLLKYGLITYAEGLYEDGSRSEAAELLQLGAEFYAEDNEYKIALEDLK